MGDNKNNKNKIEYSGRNLGKEEEFKGIYKIKEPVEEIIKADIKKNKNQQNKRQQKKIQQNKKNTKQRNMGGIVGKQKKIDADGSGTITAKDFKLLRDGNKFVARQYGGKIGK
jgi:hypothetical protein